MPYDLAAMTRRAKPGIRRSSVVLRDIVPPAVLATDLYRAAYAPVVQAWTEGAERIIAEYERSLSQITTDSAEDAESLLTTVSEAISRLVLTLTPELRSWALRVERWQRGRWRGAVLSATGVSLDTLVGPEDVRETLSTVIARNVALVKDVSAQAQGRISDAVFRGLTQRQPAREVAKEIRGAVTMARDRSIRIASHQLSAVSAELAQERRREAGLDIFAWHHSAKRFPRKEHLERDGDLYTENPEHVGKKVNGKVVKAAPPASDRAGVKPFCGCRERAVFVLAFDGED